MRLNVLKTITFCLLIALWSPLTSTVSASFEDSTGSDHYQKLSEALQANNIPLIEVEYHAILTSFQQWAFQLSLSLLQKKTLVSAFETLGQVKEFVSPLASAMQNFVKIKALAPLEPGKLEELLSTYLHLKNTLIDVYIRSITTDQKPLTFVGEHPLDSQTIKKSLEVLDSEIYLIFRSLESPAPLGLKNAPHVIWNKIKSWVFPHFRHIATAVLIVTFVLWEGRKTPSFVPVPAEDREERITLNDVPGLENAHMLMMDLIDFLKNPQPYKELEAEPDLGVLLYGPPGTGKTRFAKAFTNEVGGILMPFAGADFVSKYMGEAQKQIRLVFTKAKLTAKTTEKPVILFIDEFESIGARRAPQETHGASRERDTTLTQILHQMNELKPSDRVVVIAATNLIEAIDPALIRSEGRFSKLIHIKPPNEQERAAIINYYLNRRAKNGIEIGKFSLQELAAQTPHFTGADLKHLIKEAARHAAKTHPRDKKLTNEDITAVFEKVKKAHDERNKANKDFYGFQQPLETPSSRISDIFRYLLKNPRIQNLQRRPSAIKPGTSFEAPF